MIPFAIEELKKDVGAYRKIREQTARDDGRRLAGPVALSLFYFLFAHLHPCVDRDIGYPGDRYGEIGMDNTDNYMVCPAPDQS